MKKVFIIIFSCILFLTSCSTKNTFVQGEITHAKLFDNYAAIQISGESYFLNSTNKVEMKKFKDFYHEYYSKVDKQALALHLLQRSYDKKSGDFTYFFFLEKNKLDQATISKLEKIYGAKPYQDKYIMLGFSAKTQSYYKKDLLEDAYKLEHPIPIVITREIPFEETGGGQFLLMITMPIWVPFMILFGLKV
ncbi:hypothetical protein FEF05_00285 [Glaesserella parasuis]|uniref:Lipoprotein n=1 Tax=[Actinobacillus] rossii TaxID=123820 RepID=A0A380TPW1_9PAST|nr:hypothetical protein [Glaesserella parasuis]MDO9758283.1 hypothetical protein [Glaesserella parasuis]QEM87086.1 hypothetical protein FEF05_00285 [Glaesserella parasuis]SUT88897.1 Uncharacterised protein [[Actinobacillus] rossii]